jgi:hypothetical protein
VLAYTNKRNAEVVQIERSILVKLLLRSSPCRRSLEIEQRRLAQTEGRGSGRRV